MAMTIAKTGRSIKNFAMRILLVLQWLRVDGRARTQRRQAIDNHAIARLEALFDNPVCAGALAQHKCSGLRLVARPHGHHRLGALQFADCPLRHQQNAFAFPYAHTNPAELAGQ